MKTLAVIAGLAIVLMFVVTSCADRTRNTCEIAQTEARCEK